MTNSEKKKIGLILFHVFALMILFVSLSLVLEEIFICDENSSDILNCFEPNSNYILAIISILIGSISWIINLMKWIKKRKLEFYLKSIFLAQTLLIPGIFILLFV